MARRYELITELYERTRAAVTSPQEWQKFLDTACRNYKLPFDEQLLLFAQRPDATAVLDRAMEQTVWALGQPWCDGDRSL